MRIRGARPAIAAAIAVLVFAVITFGAVSSTRRSAEPVPGAAVWGCPAAGVCAGVARDRSDALDIVGRGAGPALPFVVGSTAYLAAGARSYRLVGYDARDACASVARSPNGRDLIYGTSRHGWPALELLDLVTGARSLFRAHACDPAWGDENRLAYVHYVADDADLGSDSGRILVQHGIDAPPSPWTAIGGWTNLIWAADGLLANDDRPGPAAVSPGPLEIIRGPGQQLSVDGHSGRRGPFEIVVAVNPPGTEAVLDTEQLGPGGAGPGAEDRAALLQISNDTVLSTLRLNGDEARVSDLAALAPDGSWSQGEVITTDGVFLGGSTHPPATLVTLSVDHDRVRLMSVRPFLIHGRLPLAQDLDNVSQARFLDRDGVHVAVFFTAIGQLEYLACDMVTDRCLASANYAAEHATQATFLTGPSRP